MNKCQRHYTKYDSDQCPVCARQEYEASFQAECYRNVEEKHCRYVYELLNNFYAQSIELSRLKSENKILRKAIERLHRSGYYEALPVDIVSAFKSALRSERGEKNVL